MPFYFPNALLSKCFHLMTSSWWLLIGRERPMFVSMIATNYQRYLSEMKYPVDNYLHSTEIVAAEQIVLWIGSSLTTMILLWFYYCFQIDACDAFTNTSQKFTSSLALGQYCDWSDARILIWLLCVLKMLPFVGGPAIADSWYPSAESPTLRISSSDMVILIIPMPSTVICFSCTTRSGHIIVWLECTKRN